MSATGEVMLNVGLQGQNHLWSFRVIGKDLHSPYDPSNSAAGLNSHRYSSAAAGLQMARTEHSRSASSGGFYALYNEFCCPGIGEFKGMLQYFSLDRVAKIMCLARKPD